MPDCGDNSCRYAHDRGGTNLGACRCDDCPECGAVIRPRVVRARHRPGCSQPDWLPEHHDPESTPADLADDR